MPSPNTGQNNLAGASFNSSFLCQIVARCHPMNFNAHLNLYSMQPASVDSLARNMSTDRLRTRFSI